MSFRNDGTTSHHWRRWKTEHQDALLRCGLPDFILATGHQWFRFLEEGYDIATGWNSSLLTTDRQRELYEFIRQQYGNDIYRGLLRDLENLLGITPSLTSGSL
jgi:hypothetical protein